MKRHFPPLPKPLPPAPPPPPPPAATLDLTGNDMRLIVIALNTELEVLNIIERRGIEVSDHRAAVSLLVVKLKGMGRPT